MQFLERFTWLEIILMITLIMILLRYWLNFERLTFTKKMLTDLNNINNSLQEPNKENLIRIITLNVNENYVTCNDDLYDALNIALDELNA